VRPPASDRLILAAFVLLAAGSLGLKAAAGPPRDGLMNAAAGAIERQVERSLQAQHFGTSQRTFLHRSTLILGQRGACTVAVRDARDGVAAETIFARDASGVGPVRYFYRGRTYAEPPAFAMRLGRLETELADRLGLSPRAPVAIAIAASPACGAGDYELADIRI
jgi:hypothetical protein